MFCSDNLKALTLPAELLTNTFSKKAKYATHQHFPYNYPRGYPAPPCQRDRLPPHTACSNWRCFTVNIIDVVSETKHHKVLSWAISVLMVNLLFIALFQARFTIDALNCAWCCANRATLELPHCKLSKAATPKLMKAGQKHALLLCGKCVWKHASASRQRHRKTTGKNICIF